MTDVKVGRIEQLTHTPGEWHISDLDRQTIGPRRVIRANGTDVPQLLAVARVMERTNETAANARLIAAAPDLLEALKAIVDSYEGDAFDGRYRRAVAAINKAEGR